MEFIKRNLFSLIAITAIGILVVFFAIPKKNTGLSPQGFVPINDRGSVFSFYDKSQEEKIEETNILIPEKNIHIKTPEKVKAVYMSSWAASSPSFREKIFDIIDSTEINSVVIDVKDSTGTISFLVNDEDLKIFNGGVNRIRSIDEFISTLHQKNIYVIARISVFQDPIFVKKYPSQAVLSKSTKKVWQDRKGLSWVDASSPIAHKYTSLLAQEAYSRGFDEINLDYIRFPSDGNLKDIEYPISKDLPRVVIMQNFFSYIDTELRGKGIPVSADIFGLTTTSNDDLGIGQVWEDAIIHFDFVAPMVYPSHFANGTFGFKNPAEKPGEVISLSLTQAIARTEKLGLSKEKIRPWLQDFDLGAKYTPELVRAQISATENLGLDSWMLWDPANTYTKDALINENN